MKRVKFLKLASAMLVLCLVTTCAISTTLAKYTTGASVDETARVAKWGITMDQNGESLFSDTYEATVKSNGSDNVVAPGTAGSIVYEVNGTPEVAYEITFDYEGLEEIYLKEGDYKYEDAEGRVNYDDSMDQHLGAPYYPIKYTVAISAANGDISNAQFADGTETFDTLKAALDALKNTKITFEVNEEAATTVTISWAWNFSTDATTDAYDTILGDLAAGNGDLTSPADAVDNLNIAYTLKMTATQLD